MEPSTSSKRLRIAARNWLDLPRDVTIQIFIKLGVVDLIYAAQFVCLSWLAIAKDPQLYRVIDLRDPIEAMMTWFRFYRVEPIQKMAELAIHRSHDHLVEFSMGKFCTDLILHKLTYTSPWLKSLRIALGQYVSPACVIQVIQKLPLLEEVEFFVCSYSYVREVDDLIRVVGRSCPGLKSFRLYRELMLFPFGGICLNDEAFAIAGSLNPGLRSLHLFRNPMDNDGLKAILDRFSQLEYLDLRQCSNVDLGGDLLKKCQGIKTLRLPDDSIRDYEFDKTVLISSDEDDEDEDDDDDDDDVDVDDDDDDDDDDEDDDDDDDDEDDDDDDDEDDDDNDDDNDCEERVVVDQLKFGPDELEVVMEVENEQVQEDQQLVSIDIEESLDIVAEDATMDEEPIDDDAVDRNDEGEGEGEDELRRRVEEFIKKINKAWKAEKLAISHYVERDTSGD